jgi:hypothetical protein
MPSQADEWGQDPSVRRMRKVFSSMEMAQEDLLRRTAVSTFDSRLRPIRTKALESFEEAWALSVRRGLALNEEEVASLYLLCLVKELVSEGIQVPSDLAPANDRITALFKEGAS